jgi:hypothetical protein
MTVVLEDQVKTITAEISEQFRARRHLPMSLTDDEIEDVVRTVIAQYDISSIARLEVAGEDDPGRPVPHHGSGP